MNITSHWVAGIYDCAVPCSGTGSHDISGKLVSKHYELGRSVFLRLVAVEMPGMAGWSKVVKDNTDGLRIACVVNVPFRVRRVRRVAGLRQKQKRIVVVPAECRVIDGPYQMSGCIDGKVNIHINSLLRFSRR